jgi:hypothetical protein
MKYLANILLFIICLTGIAFSQRVDEDKVKIVAENWLKENSNLLIPQASNSIQLENEIIQVSNSGSEIIAYALNLKPLGFIILSTDYRFHPVIAYSSEGKINPDDLHSEDNFLYGYLIEDYNIKIFALTSEKLNLKIVNNNLESWKKYLQENLKTYIFQSPTTIYGPFLNSDWGQGNISGQPVFNYYSPNNWPIGCVATATAQILNYYKWPIRGTGNHSYTDNNTGTHTADFYNTFYDWTNTLDVYKNVLLTNENKQAAGLLSYHAAVSLDMDFEYNGSTASTSDVPNALKNYFRFSGHYTSSSTTGFWDELKNNMIDSRPGIVSISGNGNGHAAVVDGYSDINNYYHLNPGWLSDYNGWYNISGTWNMSGYNTVNGAVKGIVPSPMINLTIQKIDSLSFILSWYKSIHQNADYYELQQATSFGGTYTTLSSSIADTFYTVTVPSVQSYYYRVRAYRDSIWWDYSYPAKITLGEDINLKFSVDMNNVSLDAGDEVVIRGNLPPLSGSVNSDPMTDNDSDGIYELTLTFNFDYAGSLLLYRFFIQKQNELIAESFTRSYTLTTAQDQILDTAVFNQITSVDFNGTNCGEITEYSLAQNYPNPFNPVTVISFSLPMRGNVKLTVFDALGKEVAELLDKEMTLGIHKISFDAKNLASGIYFYRLQSGNYVEMKKMILLR